MTNIPKEYLLHIEAGKNSWFQWPDINKDRYIMVSNYKKNDERKK